MILPPEILLIIVKYLDDSDVPNFCEVVDVPVTERLYKRIFREPRLHTSITLEMFRNRSKAEAVTFRENNFLHPMLIFTGSKERSSSIFKTTCVKLLDSPISLISKNIKNILILKASGTVTAAYYNYNEFPMKNPIVVDFDQENISEMTTGLYHTLFVDREGAVYRSFNDNCTARPTGLHPIDKYVMHIGKSSVPEQGRISKLRQGGCYAVCTVEGKGLFYWDHIRTPRSYTSGTRTYLLQGIMEVELETTPIDYVVLMGGRLVFLLKDCIRSLDLDNGYQERPFKGRFVQLVCNGWQIAVLAENGRVAVGTRELDFQYVDVPAGVISVAVGRKHCFAVTTEGALYSWKFPSDVVERVPIEGYVFGVYCWGSRVTVLVSGYKEKSSLLHQYLLEVRSKYWR